MYQAGVLLFCDIFGGSWRQQSLTVLAGAAYSVWSQGAELTQLALSDVIRGLGNLPFYGPFSFVHKARWFVLCSKEMFPKNWSTDLPLDPFLKGNFLEGSYRVEQKNQPRLDRLVSMRLQVNHVTSLGLHFSFAKGEICQCLHFPQAFTALSFLLGTGPSYILILIGSEMRSLPWWPELSLFVRFLKVLSSLLGNYNWLMTYCGPQTVNPQTVGLTST